ncbi:MAG: hypothetical protein DRZ82_09410 [Thermoprotei archaeon]|nr:MAG: hypothetical protein DRZ82_09410 [Thermoprotei archaeon]
MSVNRGYLEKLVADVRASVDVILRITSKPYKLMSEVERYAVRYHLIVIAEAVRAMVFHFVRRVFRVDVESFSQALQVLRERGFIGDRECEELIKFVGIEEFVGA